MNDPMQNPSNALSDSHLLKNLENRVSTLQDLIQDRRLSLSSRLSLLRPGDLYFIDSSQDDISYQDYQRFNSLILIIYCKRGWTPSFSSSNTSEVGQPHSHHLIHQRLDSLILII